MPLSSYRMHRIYLAATMNYGLGSDDSEELAYYNKIRKEMNDMKKDPIKKGITFSWNISKPAFCGHPERIFLILSTAVQQ